MSDGCQYPSRGGLLGVAFAGCAAFLVSATSLASKLCCSLPPGQLLFAGSLGVLAAGALALPSPRQPFPKGSRRYLLAYSLAASQASVASLQAIRLMPLSDEALIAYNSIPLATLLARIFLKEPCPARQIVSCLLVIFGVEMVAQPTLDHAGYPFYLTGVFISLYASTCDSISFILVKHLQNVPRPIVLFNLGLVSTISSSLCAIFETWKPPNEILFLSCFVYLYIMYEVYFTMAINVERVGLVAIVQASDIAFAYMWEIIFFQEEYNLLKIIGSVIIVSVIIFSVILKDK